MPSQNDKPRRSLRGSMNWINAKTFKPKIHNRQVFFAAGYSEAVKRLERDHQVCCFVQGVVEVYTNLEASLVTPQYGVEKVLRIFNKKGVEAVLKELKQLHNMNVGSPKYIQELGE